jgi:hypothetical protein
MKILQLHKHNNHNSNITVQGFFSLYPQLHPYLLKQLQRASEPVHKSSFTLAPRRHPLLHPTLLLLSRLRPALVAAAANATGGSNDGDSEESSSNSVNQQQLTAAPFVPLVMQTRGSGCVSHTHLLLASDVQTAFVTVVFVVVTDVRSYIKGDNSAISRTYARVYACTTALLPACTACCSMSEHQFNY